MNKEPEESLLMDHEADGIRELDNNLPRWWVLLFYGTILFSVVYLTYYHVLGMGVSSQEQYAMEMARAAELRAAAEAKSGFKIDELEPSADQEVLELGKSHFKMLCTPCHGPQAQGLVGPNLTDDYWIHGSEFKDNLRIITEGNPVKGMISWKTTLKPKDIYAVASYIYTLRGSNPPNPKPPENQVAGSTPDYEGGGVDYEGGGTPDYEGGGVDYENGGGSIYE